MWQRGTEGGTEMLRKGIKNPTATENGNKVSSHFRAAELATLTHSPSSFLGRTILFNLEYHRTIIAVLN